MLFVPYRHLYLPVLYAHVLVHHSFTYVDIHHSEFMFNARIYGPSRQDQALRLDGRRPLTIPQRT